MKTSITYKRIWNVAYPIILGSIAQNLINFTDTAFLGRVGEVALGASALGGIFYLAIIMLGLGFGTGAQIIVARRYGEKELKKIGPVIDHSTIFLFFLAILVFSLLQYGSESLLKNALKSEAVFEETLAYLNIRSYGVFFAFLNMVFRSFYVGLAKTKVITYTTFVMATVNIVLDYVLIFGHFGAPVMGIEGAALASLISEAFALLFFFMYSVFTVKFSDYNLFRFVNISFKQMMAILKISVPMMMQSFISLSVWFVFFLFIEKLGETSLAVSNIIRSVFVLLMMPIWGFATATNTLVSYLIGLNRENEVMLLIGKIVLLTFTGVLAIVSFGLVFPRLVMEIYTNDPNLVTLGIPVLKVVSVGALLLSVGFILFNGVSGTGKTNISLIIEILVLSVYLVYTYLMINQFGGAVADAWTAEWVYGSLLALLSFVYLKSHRWKSANI